MESEKSTFSSLPDEIVIKVLSLLSPYGDFDQAKQVCKRWRRLVKIVVSQDNANFYNAIKTGSIQWGKLLGKTEETFKDGLPVLKAGIGRRGGLHSRSMENVTPSPRFSLCACCHNDAMYVFGGCSPLNIALNDMFKLDLRTKVWSKVETRGILPSPRECCTMVNHKDTMVIFGGWCQPRRIDLAPRFFNQVHIFDITTQTWSTIEETGEEEKPLERAGHNASTTKNKMIVIGGAQRNKRFDDVWVFDLNSFRWHTPQIRGTKPSKRFGHSQFIMNEDFVLIVGGCGGPGMLFNDAWLLNTYGWQWTEIKLRNKLFEPPLLWCHPAVRVKDQIVIFSEQRTCKECTAKKNGVETTNSADEELCDTCSSGTVSTSSPSVPPLKMQMYVLDCSKCVLGHHGSWRNIPTSNKSPLSRSLYSAIVGKGELVIFGGVQNTQQPDAIQTANNNLLFVAPKDRRL